MFVSDLRHFLDLPVDAPGPARRMADRLTRIVRAASAGDVGEPWTSAIRCERRPGRRPCEGFVEILRPDPADTVIRWGCGSCDDEGLISGWEASPYDLRQIELRATDEQVVVEIDADIAGALHRIPTLDRDSQRLVFRACVVDGGVVLVGSADALENLAEHVASEVNDEARRARQKHLHGALAALEHRLASTASR